MTDDVLNTKEEEDEEKNVVDFSQLIMEKLKFLNDGKSSVTPVQVMAIQIEVRPESQPASRHTYINDRNYFLFFYLWHVNPD